MPATARPCSKGKSNMDCHASSSSSAFRCSSPRQQQRRGAPAGGAGRGAPPARLRKTPAHLPRTAEPHSRARLQQQRVPRLPGTPGIEGRHKGRQVINTAALLQHSQLHSSCCSGMHRRRCLLPAAICSATVPHLHQPHQLHRFVRVGCTDVTQAFRTRHTQRQPWRLARSGIACTSSMGGCVAAAEWYVLQLGGPFQNTWPLTYNSCTQLLVGAAATGVPKAAQQPQPCCL